MDRFLFKNGFTLAEMLVVLLIVSLVAVASVPLAHKRFKAHKPKTVHGKYECFYASDGVTLKENLWEGTTKVRDNVTVASCAFTPNPKATYFIVQAIGGGGGGAYSGTVPVRSESTYDGDITFPADGNMSVPSSPDWLTTEFNSANFQMVATVYGGGGGGGSGNANPVPAPGNPGPCDERSNSIPGCHWIFDYWTTGGTGGTGGSCTTAQEPLTSTTLVKLQSGSAGLSGSAGGTGEIIMGTKSCTATGGLAGQNASPTSDGSPGGDGSPNPTVAGGLGGQGFAGNVYPGYNPTVPSYTPASGNSGSYLAPITTINGVAQNSIPYSYGVATKQLAYGEGGAAGSYSNMFFSKLATGLVITVGAGGYPGTSGHPAGSDGGDTKVGPLLARGGTGGSATSKLTTPYDLYTAAQNGPPYTITTPGGAGGLGSFYAVVHSAAFSETPGVTADAALGNGGTGGGSSACVGLNSSRSLNGSSLQTMGLGSTTCKTKSDDALSNVSNNGSKGHSGAIVIIW